MKAKSSNKKTSANHGDLLTFKSAPPYFIKLSGVR